MTANQLYKESGSNLSFKEWLKETQNKGILDNHEEMFNLLGVDGSEEKENNTSTKTLTRQQTKSSMGVLNMVGLIGLGVLLYGLATTKSQ